MGGPIHHELEVEDETESRVRTAGPPGCGGRGAEPARCAEWCAKPCQTARCAWPPATHMRRGGGCMRRFAAPIRSMLWGGWRGTNAFRSDVLALVRSATNAVDTGIASGRRRFRRRLIRLLVIGTGVACSSASHSGGGVRICHPTPTGVEVPVSEATTATAQKTNGSQARRYVRRFVDREHRDHAHCERRIGSRGTARIGPIVPTTGGTRGARDMPSRSLAGPPCSNADTARERRPRTSATRASSRGTARSSVP